MDADELTPEMCKVILELSEWDGPEFVAQGRVLAVAVRGEFPPLDWDY